MARGGPKGLIFLGIFICFGIFAVVIATQMNSSSGDSNGDTSSGGSSGGESGGGESGGGESGGEDLCADVECPAASTQCMVAGECIDGVCSEETFASIGTPCDDGNDNTVSDTCTENVCEGRLTREDAQLSCGESKNTCNTSCNNGYTTCRSVSSNTLDTCLTELDTCNRACDTVNDQCIIDNSAGPDYDFVIPDWQTDEVWVHQPNKKCLNTIQWYTNRDDAERECITDPECWGLYDPGCNYHGQWATCKGPEVWDRGKHTSDPTGCLYGKGSHVSPPTCIGGFIGSTVTGQNGKQEESGATLVDDTCNGGSETCANRFIKTQESSTGYVQCAMVGGSCVSNSRIPSSRIECVPDISNDGATFTPQEVQGVFTDFSVSAIQSLDTNNDGDISISELALFPQDGIDTLIASIPIPTMVIPSCATDTSSYISTPPASHGYGGQVYNTHNTCVCPTGSTVSYQSGSSGPFKCIT